jgi:hypothetical protein
MFQPESNITEYADWKNSSNITEMSLMFLDAAYEFVDDHQPAQSIGEFLDPSSFGFSEGASWDGDDSEAESEKENEDDAQPLYFGIILE